MSEPYQYDAAPAKESSANAPAASSRMDEATICQHIRALLLSLGIGRQYRGHHMAAEAVLILLRNGRTLLHFRQLILQPIAQQHECDWQCVERNLRTVISRAWQLNQERLKEITMYPLTCEPSAAEFIDILASHLMQQHQLWYYDKSLSPEWLEDADVSQPQDEA